VLCVIYIPNIKICLKTNFYHNMQKLLNELLNLDYLVIEQLFEEVFPTIVLLIIINIVIIL
jgi:hypothetical protein